MKIYRTRETHREIKAFAIIQIIKRAIRAPTHHN